MVDPVAAAKLSIQNLSFVYGDGSLALNDVSLGIKANELFVLFGPSRSGKTTLLRLLNRLSDLHEDTRRQGTILFDGRDIYEPGTNVIKLRRTISMVFATPTPLPGSIRDNMTYGLRMAGQKDQKLIDERMEKGLRQAALWDEVKDRIDQSAFALSGGQKQRLCLARSLALQPEIILLDNPTSGLDPISTTIVEESLAELKQEYTIIMVPHSVQQAARIADRAGFMLDGQLIEVGDQAQIFLNPIDSRTEDYVTGRFG
ncbi:MAG: phosphate ABC transporter ATP-binding protein [Chloroflexota bacterium]|nr:MAG: phosphate ABC transporter ATP-binding protein [Chloroflexota bacterium]